ncbi:adenylate isopentenyltransferase 5, chloroplastic [Gastrolobium bilobum]|uniref:adenylate isopentenyltransferase 5, chloroplastic n=1 Tax=Gastrolobium bilobum TaxID=150636 RepID=UPI002AB046FE|nr:adenylate isopentenyltransferase 5, chloroplastic [Gastrolobium bilobum]
MNIISGLSAAASACKPLVSFQPALTMELSLFHQRKDKVVVIMGATGSGKSKLAIDLATHFPPAEIVNCDKMQVYKGLDITTNKVTDEECRGVPHHLLGMVDPNSDFTANDFCHQASLSIGSIVGRDALPIIAGGSNSFIDALVNHQPEFRLRYECCFLWVDVSLPVLHSSLSARVDRMIEAGQIDEVRQFFDPSHDYTKGIRRAVGVPEFDEFLRTEDEADEGTKKRLLDAAIARIKINNCSLANRQLQKIHRLYNIWKRNMHRLDATESFLKGTREEAEEAWEDHVFSKSRRILHKFLYEETHVPVGIVSPKAAAIVSAPPPSPPSAMAAITH